MVPPSSVYAQPAAFTVRTSDAMLKRVRYGAERDCVRNVHWLYALAAATIIVWSAPSRRSDAKSTAYDTDIVDPLDASGRLTLKTDVIEESVIRRRNSHGDEKVL